MADVEIKVKIDGVEYTQAELKKLATVTQDTANATDEMTDSQQKAGEQAKKTAKNAELLNTTIATSLGEFENLNEAISKTQDTLTKLDPQSEKFKELAAELQVLKDSLRDTEISSSRFTEALAAQPGVIGLVGQSVEGLRGTLKVFMANPIIAVVTLIAGAFLLLKESMEKTSEGQAVLNKITEAFGKILGPVMLIVQKVALPIFEGLALVIEKVADAFTFFADALGFSEKQIAEASRGIDKVQEETAKKEEDLKKKIEERMLAEQEAAKKAEEAAKKRAEAAKKRADDQKAIEKTLEGLRVQALKDEALQLTEQVRLQKEAAVEEFKAKGASKEQIAKLESYYDELSLQKLTEYNTKKAEETQKAADDEAKRKEEADKVAAEQETARLARLNEIDFMNYQASLETDTQRQLAAIDREEQLAMQELENLKASEAQKTETMEYYADLRQQVRVQEVQNALAATAEILGNISELAGEGTETSKAAAIAQSTINTYLGATQMLADPSIPSLLKPFLLVSQLALGFKQVKEISKIEPPKAAYGGMINGPSHSAGGTMIEAEGGEFILNKYAMQQPGVAQIAQALNQVATPDRQNSGGMAPIKTYVVATDVSSAQEANQKVERLAKL